MPRSANPVPPKLEAIVKNLANRPHFTNQFVLQLINVGRVQPFNSGRISEIMSDANIAPASDEEADMFLYNKAVPRVQ